VGEGGVWQRMIHMVVVVVVVVVVAASRECWLMD
jgi:hypothetical protein